MRSRSLIAFATLALTAVPALADELGDKIRAVLERAKGNLVRVKFDQAMPEFNFGPGGGGETAGGGTRKASITGFIADEETIVVVSSALNPMGGLGRIVRMAGSQGEDLASQLEEPESSGFKAVLPDGKEITLELKKKDPETGFSFLRVKNKEKAGPLKPVVFAANEPPLADPVVLVALSGADMDYQPRFLLSRINSVADRGFPIYGTMEPVGEYQGGLAFDLKGDLVGVVAPPPKPPKKEKEGEGEATGAAGAFTFVMDAAGGGPMSFGGPRGGARLLSGKWVTQALRTMEKKQPEAR
jgi:hypothetical protein